MLSTGSRLSSCCLRIVFLAVALMCTQIPALAQSSGGAPALNAKSVDVIKRLASLSNLPVNGWAYHEGDIAHGESPALDDSKWAKVDAKAKFPAEAMWFRRWIEVPKTLDGYDLSGARIWFQFHAGANGPMPQIIYFNGRRVAMGEDLEPIVLFEPAKPGEKVLVAVKLLNTVDTKTFEAATARIDFVESRPNPDTLIAEARSAEVLLPALDAGSKMPQLDAALALVDVGALDRADQAAFDASLRAANSALEPFKPILAAS